jgi:plastocyanin
MIDTFDSRALRCTDCYGQRFMKADSYRYNVLAPMGHCMNDEQPFVVTVKDRSKKDGMVQHTVAVSFEAGKFDVDHRELAIDTGDLVLWNCQVRRAIPFVVSGEKEFFASDRLTNECGYSHAFASAGDFHWVDAYGSGLEGVVHVKDPRCKDTAGFKRWQQLLTKGTVVMVDSKKVQPREIEIVAGQTVFFAIAEAPGISITDKRILETRSKPSVSNR